MQNRVFACINALGLSIALAVSFIILLFVINELSYDHFHKNRNQIFRVLNYFVDYDRTTAETPYVLATTLKEEFPQVQKAVRTRNLRGFKLKLKDEYINVPQALATDSEVFDIFTINLIGSRLNKGLLDDQNAIILSRNLAEKIFPDQDPVGKEIVGLINNEDRVFIVKGVYENIPENSVFRATCMVNSKWTIDPINKVYNITNADKKWDINYWITWVLLSKGSNIELFDKQFSSFEKKHFSEKANNHYSLQNLSDVYLGSDKVENTKIVGNLKSIKLFLSIAFLILLVATINYIILSTAISTGRTKEIGIRKTAGADTKSIRNQLLSESILLTLLVLPIALLMMWVTLPYAGKLFQTIIHIISSNFIIYAIVYVVLAIVIGVASGVYTAAYLSRLKVISILNNTTYLGKRKQLFRSFLIIIQLVIFCSFVSSTLIIRSQYKYALSKDPGHFTQNILLIDLGRDFNGYSAYINSIKSNPNIIMAAGTIFGLPMSNSGYEIFSHFQEKDRKIQGEGIAVGYNFLKTMGITVVEGRDFSEEYGSDLTKSAILNESAVKQLGIADPIGKVIENQTIIGIVKDFNLHSIHSGIPPLIITLTDRYIMQIAVHYRPNTLNGILPMLKEEWKKVALDRPFTYSTIEEVIKDTYSSDRNLTTIVSIFALFAFLIAAIGLFGLTLFVARSRTKEIGIKKILGSSEKSIIYSFLLGNFILVSLASIISIPITHYLMTKWLNNFAYKVSIFWWEFALAFSLAATVVLLTVFINAYKASHINPIKAIKHD